MTTDKERIDWIQSGGRVGYGEYEGGTGWIIYTLPHVKNQPFRTLRKAIDAAIRTDRKDTMTTRKT